jgi:two-component system CheB/CheR fusion protein
MNAELLMRSPLIRAAPQMSKAAGTIRSSAISQAKIINDLLDLSRINTGKMELTLAEIDLAQLVRTLVDVVGEGAAIPAIGIDIVEMAADEPVLVQADSVRLEQVVWNLLSNALKFTPPEGRVDVELAREDDYVRLRVRDTGQGIHPQHLGTIFDIFGQGSASILRGTKGLGIGLALVRQIVELHGGRVSADSPGPGHGATFTVWLPVRTSGAPELAPQDAMSELPLDGARILIVDDSDEGLDAFQMLLQMAGADVTAANNGKQALALLDDHPFDILISDLAMPQMDGYTLLREVRQRPHLAELPALAMTGLGRQKDIDRAMAAGFTGHLGKPVDFDEMVREVKRMIGRADVPLPSGPIT